jgi:hypothetical protein
MTTELAGMGKSNRASASLVVGFPMSSVTRVWASGPVSRTWTSSRVIGSSACVAVLRATIVGILTGGE